MPASCFYVHEISKECLRSVARHIFEDFSERVRLRNRNQLSFYKVQKNDRAVMTLTLLQ